MTVSRLLHRHLIATTFITSPLLFLSIDKCLQRGVPTIVKSHHVLVLVNTSSMILSRSILLGKRRLVLHPLHTMARY